MKNSLFGYGKTTKAIAEILGEKFGGFAIYDDKFTPNSHKNEQNLATKIEKSDKFGNLFLNPSEFDPKKSVLEIPSPGFPRDHALIKKARNLMSEYDFFYDAMPKSVWISGTNGKTTTTQMAQHLLADFGAQMGGNVGVPLAELNANARLWILETSSFTLHYTRVAKCEIYALLPITEDHISWHGSFEAYESAKLSVLARMNEGDVAIMPQIYAEKAAKSGCKALIIGYKDEADLAAKFGINLDEIAFKTPFLLDAVMALSIEKILLDRVSYERINAFKIEENKLEEFYDRHARLWVNDTKATNIDAVKAALARYQGVKIHLILGGDSKGVSLEPLFRDFERLNITLYAIGSCVNEILTLAKSHKITAHKCDTLQNAVNLIDKNFKIAENANLNLNESAGNLAGNPAKKLSNAENFENFSLNLNGNEKNSVENLSNSKAGNFAENSAKKLSNAGNLGNYSSLNSKKNAGNLAVNLGNLNVENSAKNLVNLNKNARNSAENSLNLSEVALLSPACASLDQFSSYAQRGEIFKKCVRGL